MSKGYIDMRRPITLRTLLLVYLGIGLLCITLYYVLYYSQPAVWATLWMEAEAERIPGVTVQNIIDVSSIWDQEVYTFLDVEGKGMLVLSNLTIDSFTTETGPVILEQIGGCTTTAGNLNSGYMAKNYPELYVKSVSELVQKYDEIYAELHVAKIGVDAPRCGTGRPT